jgi:hypothetical protein
LAVAAGFLGRASYGLGCFYAKQPYGSTCNEFEAMLAFAQFSLSTAAGLYVVWGVLLLVGRGLKKRLRGN